MSGMPRHLQLWLALAGVLALAVCAALGRHAPQQALLGYLPAFLFFTGLGVGSLALLMIHALTGGAWGARLRMPLLCAARCLPLMALLALPLLCGASRLYPWADAARLASDAQLRAQSWYLSLGGFLVRSFVYFAAWLGLLALLQRHADDALRMPRIAAGGLIVFALTTLFAASDWAMSLLPHWHSSVFGMRMATAWLLSAAALAIGLACLQDADTQPSSPDLRRDLGSLLLMLVLAAAYLAFMQYLTIWVADLPAENAWYIPRTLTSWRMLAAVLVALEFAVPFVVLLSRHAKSSRRWLGAIAAVVIAGQLCDSYWITVPSLRTRGFSLSIGDALALCGIGALWCALLIGQWHTLSRAAPNGRAPREDATEPAHA